MRNSSVTDVHSYPDGKRDIYDQISLSVWRPCRASEEAHLEHFIGFVQDENLHGSVGQHSFRLPIFELAMSAYDNLLIDY